MYLIDTNMIAYFIRGNNRVIELFEKYKNSIYFCSTVQMECEYGALKSGSTKLMTFYSTIFDSYKYIGFGKNESSCFAKIKNNLRIIGITVEDYDLMIASQAITNNFTLVTNNTKHFENIEGLKLEDWSV